MEYDKQGFDIQRTQPVLDQYLTGHRGSGSADRRDGLVYVYTDEIELTVNIALATGRPVLLRGPSGSGKSTLARNVALRLERRYYEEVITSKSQHTDLQWHFDLLRRFRDAQTNHLKADANYIEPRGLWWAFDPTGAARRGMVAPDAPEQAAADPSDLRGGGAVLLIDEIDKADPDLPNNLLVALGSLQFTVPDLDNTKVQADRSNAPLVFITSNDERDLAVAFLRRCLVLELKAPGIDRVIEIAARHFGDTAPRRDDYREIAMALYGKTGSPPISTAEYLDTVQACDKLGVKPKDDDDVWKSIISATIRKPMGFGERQA
jgi:MoxR-like ATPase